MLNEKLQHLHGQKVHVKYLDHAPNNLSFCISGTLVVKSYGYEINLSEQAWIHFNDNDVVGFGGNEVELN